MLKKIAHPPLSNGNVDALFPVKQRPRPDGDVSGLRFFNTGHALQGLALSTAGSSENAEDAALMMERYIEGERAPIFVDRKVNHAGRLLSRLRFSKRLTVISTTALMAILTKTQIKALYSSLVLHNW